MADPGPAEAPPSLRPAGLRGLGWRLRYPALALAAAGLSLLTLQLLVGRLQARQQIDQLADGVAANLLLGAIGLERFSPQALSTLSGMRLAVGERPAGSRDWRQLTRRDRELREQGGRLRAALCRRLTPCPALRPAAANPRGVWVEMDASLETVWLFVPLQPAVGWPPDPGLLSLSLGLGGLTAGLLFQLQEVQRPLRRLEQALSQVALAAGGAPLPPRGTASVRRLTGRFNAMVEQLERNERERSTMLAGIAHDLRSPLTRLRLRLHLAAEARRPTALERPGEASAPEEARDGGPRPLGPAAMAEGTGEPEVAPARPAPEPHDGEGLEGPERGARPTGDAAASGRAGAPPAPAGACPGGERTDAVTTRGASPAPGERSAGREVAPAEATAPGGDRTPRSAEPLPSGLPAEEAAAIATDLDALERITGQFLLFAGADRQEEPVLLPLEALLAETAAAVVGHLPLELELTALQRRVRPTALARAITNLLENAVAHGHPPLRLVLRPLAPEPGGAATDGATGEGFEIQIWDRGAGISREDWPRALTPFLRLDGARRGRGHSGLGLAIAGRIAADHGGGLRRLEGEAGFGVALWGRSLPPS